MDPNKLLTKKYILKETSIFYETTDTVCRYAISEQRKKKGEQAKRENSNLENIIIAEQ